MNAMAVPQVRSNFVPSRCRNVTFQIMFFFGFAHAVCALALRRIRSDPRPQPWPASTMGKRASPSVASVSSAKTKRLSVATPEVSETATTSWGTEELQDELQKQIGVGASDGAAGPSCALCKRSRSFPNPVKAMAGQFLQFVSAKRALCKICRNYTNQAFPGQKAVDISAGLKQSPDKQADYDKEVIKFQQSMEAKARNGYMRVTGCREDWNPPSVVNVSTAGIDSGDMMKGIFWPQEIYKAHTGEALPKKQLTRHVHRGKTYWGIIRETEYGNPIGTIKLKDIDQRKIEHVSQAANTENGSTSAQVRWIAGLLNTPSG